MHWGVDTLHAYLLPFFDLIGLFDDNRVAVLLVDFFGDKFG